MPGGLAGIVLRDDDAASIGVEQDLAGIKAPAAGGGEPPVHSGAVKLVRPYLRDEGVPIVIASAGSGVQRDHARWPRVIFRVEEQQLDSGGVARDKNQAG